MNTSMFSKLVFFAAAFLINGLMLAGVNYLFNDQTHERTARASLAQRADGTRPLYPRRSIRHERG
jgi:hypothetical protein